MMPWPAEISGLAIVPEPAWVLEYGRFPTSYPALSKLWIKICGITRNADARAAAALGADALGAVLYPPSSRVVEVAQLASVFSGLPSTTRRVALFVNPERSLVDAVLATGVIDLLQFHGDEDEQFCASFPAPYMKAIRVASKSQAVEELRAFPSAEMMLLDSYQKNVPGGTGKTFDWNIAAELVRESNHRVVLAGGLEPENVAEAVRQVGPFGVDVSSGVETTPGIKGQALLEEFIEGAVNG